MSGQGYPSLPTSLPFREEALRRIAQVVNGILGGKTNNVGTVTCTAGATSTVVTDNRIGPNSAMPLDPTTANAAAELGAGTVYWSSRGKGAATLTHANAGTADRIFRFPIVG